MSHGFGSTKHPDSCIARNFAATESFCSCVMPDLRRIENTRQPSQSKRHIGRLAGGANHRFIMLNTTAKPRQGRRKTVAYVIDTSQPALSYRFRNKKSRADNPTGVARRLARISWRNHPDGGWNRGERGRR